MFSYRKKELTSVLVDPVVLVIVKFLFLLSSLLFLLALLHLMARSTYSGKVYPLPRSTYSVKVYPVPLSTYSVKVYPVPMVDRRLWPLVTEGC